MASNLMLVASSTMEKTNGVMQFKNLKQKNFFGRLRILIMNLEYMKNGEEYNKDSKISIDCKSSYIKFIKYGIILLLLFLS